MARRMPSAEGNLLLHPALSLTILIAWIAASIVILASLCASCHRKPTTTSPKSPSSPSPLSDGSVGKTASIQAQEQGEEEEDGPPIAGEGITELEAPIHGPIFPTVNMPAGSTSKRRLSGSLSIGLKEGLSRIKTKKENIGRGRGEGEESLWKKTIILGEKCRMQNEDAGEERNATQSNLDAKSPRSESFASAEAAVS